MHACVSIKTDKERARNLVDIAKKQGKIFDLELSNASTNRKIFNERIPLGPSKIKLPDMQFSLSIEEVEKLIESTPEEDYIKLTLKPVADNEITIIFKNWLRQMLAGE